MGQYRAIDLSNADFLREVAALPFYGQAQQIVRMRDPLWKSEIGEPRIFKVSIEKVCGCNCPHCIEEESKTVDVEAVSGEQAAALAEAEYSEWEIIDVRLPRCGCEVPDDFLRKPTR